MATINENACLPRSNFGRILAAEMGAERLPTLGRRPARAIYCLSLLVREFFSVVLDGFVVMMVLMQWFRRPKNDAMAVFTPVYQGKRRSGAVG